jgi:translocation and assembly module TamA
LGALPGLKNEFQLDLLVLNGGMRAMRRPTPHGPIRARLCLLMIGTTMLFGSPAWAQDVPLPNDDHAFDAALPPLDQTVAPVETAPATANAETPQSQPDPTQLDTAQLDAPLPPLANFDPTPPAQTGAETLRAAKTEQIPYRVDISGLDKIGLEGPFRAQSALLHDGRKGANITQIRARADEDRALAERLLRSVGYLDGIATATIPASAPADQPLVVTVTATPGEIYHLRSVTLTGIAPDPAAIARDALALKVGDPIAALPIQDAEARIALRLPERGYPFVKTGQRDILIDDAAPVGDYTLPVESGPKSSFGILRTEGDPVFALNHLNVFPRFKAGETYDSRKVDDLRQALIATSLLSTVSIEPVDTGAKAADGSAAVDLLVRQSRGKARTLSASAGYGTGEGLKLVGEYQNRNWSSPEGALILDATAGTQQQSVGATFRRSNAGKRDRTFQASATVSRQRYDAYNAETLDLAASLSRQSTPIWQKRWTYSLGSELIATRETPFVANDPSRPHSLYYIAALPLQGGYDRSDDLLNPTRGVRATLKLSPEVQKQNKAGLDQYVRALAEVSGYYPLLDRSLVLAARARVGSIVGAPRDSIAPSRRYYSGGGGSVRGFGYQQLGPKDANNDPVGGRSLTEFAVEARYRFGTYGIVPFFDAGRVGQASTPSLSGMRYGVGIGARYYTNFGPFRLDVATPLNRQKGEAKVAVYISIGQAF